MELQKILFEKKDGIGFITLNDPENQNTISGIIVDELADCIDQCSDDSDVRVIVLRGAGKVFSAGANIRGMKEKIERGEIYNGDSLRKLGAVVMKLRNIRKPVIASMHGASAGGGLSLALACDFRITTEDIKMIFAFVNLALIPDCGGPFPLVKMVGVSRATELLMTAKLFSGKEAYEWGMVNKAVPQDQLEEATMKLAKKLANGPTVAYGMIKALINRNSFSGLELELDNEMEYQILCAASEDYKEGVNAFLEKRKPAFKGC